MLSREALAVQAEAETGDRDAQYSLALMHHYGEGFAESHEQAAEWFRRAAEQEHPGAQAALGDYCRHGQGGLEEDRGAALEWYQLAADQGDSYAEFRCRSYYA